MSNLNESEINQLESTQSTQSISESSLSPTQPDTSKPKTKRKSSKPRQKELTLSDIKKQAEQLNTLSTYVVNKEKNVIVKYYERFDEEKIEELLLELNEHVQYDQKHNIGFFKNDEDIIKYIPYLIVKYFSRVNEFVSSDFEDNKLLSKELRKLGYIRLFHDDIFNPEEVAKVFDRFYERIELVEKVITLDDETKAKLENLQHKDILFNKLNTNKIIPEA